MQLCIASFLLLLLLIIIIIIIIVPFDDNPLPSEIPVTREGFVLLGFPIVPPSFCVSSVHHRVAKLKSILSLLPSLEDSQIENTLLRWCLAFPKINFALRTCPPSFLQEAIAEFDSAMFDSLSYQVGGYLPSWSSQ